MLSPVEESTQMAEDVLYRKVREELVDLGLWEVGMSTGDMLDILEVVRNSKQSAEQEQSFREAIKESNSPEPEERSILRRRYIAAPEQRLPWSILPKNLKPSQKKQVIIKYWHAMSRTQHTRAKFSINFDPWPAPIDVPRETFSFRSLRSTRSGRCAPNYTISDEESDFEESGNRKTRKKRPAVVNNTNNAGKAVLVEVCKGLEKRKRSMEPVEGVSMSSPMRETKSSSPEIELITVEAEIHRENSPMPNSPTLTYTYNESVSPEIGVSSCTNTKRIKKSHSS